MSNGGANNDGTVFELTPKAGRGWAEKVLHSFNYKDGYAPGALIFDASARYLAASNKTLAQNEKAAPRGGFVLVSCVATTGSKPIRTD
jgi:hypothetical protein